ncbi:CPBP family intramembrane glutamic endopeptidase [Vibrio hippocampi]
MNSDKPLFAVDEHGVQWSSVVISMILHGLLYPILEELFFRKTLFQRLSETTSIKLSFVISSVCFALIHNNMISALVASFFLCYIYLKFGFFAVIICHGIHNLFILFIYLVYFYFNDHHMLVWNVISNNMIYFPLLLILNMVLILLYKLRTSGLLRH